MAFNCDLIQLAKVGILEAYHESATLADERSPLNHYSMPTYLVNWNPKRWTWEDHGEFVAKTRAGKKPKFDWTTGNRKNVKTGDRIFLVRQSTDRGIIGSGHAISDSFESPHWDESRDDLANAIEIRWDAILDTSDVLPVSILESADLGVPWNNLMASGIQVPEESATRFERLWADHLDDLLQRQDSLPKMVFLRTGWMERYRGTKNDPIIGGGKYVDENGFGHEAYNFLPHKGRVYGYCRNTGGPKTKFEHGAGIKLERLGGGTDNDKLEGVLAVWLATRPNGGIEIVGWYQNARVYRAWQERPHDSGHAIHGEICGFHVSTLEANATLVVPDERRTFSRLRPGRANVWYADKPEDTDLRRDVFRYIANYGLPTYPDEIDESRSYPVPAPKRVTVNAYERDPRARAECIKIYGTSCVVCEFDFEAQYGELGRAMIHVHHLVQLARVKSGYEVNPKTDLRPVCPNCHAIIHRPRGEMLTIKEAQQRVRHRFPWCDSES
jgi:5-methylcytosine-specific restriction enzyme A